ncbi:MAG: hypothetical protein N2511_06310 [Thermodesulfovibrionales bacterium]|nr:hypothetical protein [Thermodesulfovibrionales bacterium]
MKITQLSKKGLYVGAIIGIILFVLIGLLPSSFIGGVLGLKIASHIFGVPLGMAIMPRIIVGITMVLGVLITGTIFVMGLSFIGWLCGYVIEVLKDKKAEVKELATKEHKI